MQTELKKIQKKLGITFIFVTQMKALTMSDKIIVMNKGRYNKWELHKIYTMNRKFICSKIHR